MDEIVDKDSLRAWLEGQPREVSIAIAARSALRVVPMLNGYFWPDWEIDDRAGLVLKQLRCSLTSLVASDGPTSEVQGAAASARSAADSAAASAAFSAADSAAADSAAARSADSARSAAVLSADSASAASAAVFSAAAASAASAAAASAVFSADSAAFSAVAFVAFSDSAAAAADSASAAAWLAIEREIANAGEPADVLEILNTPLWPDGKALWPDGKALDGFDTAWASLMLNLSESGGDWWFWIRWYERCLRGWAQNWDMLREVVLIEETVWEAGVEAVLAEIAEIEARYSV